MYLHHDLPRGVSGVRGVFTGELSLHIAGGSLSQLSSPNISLSCVVNRLVGILHLIGP